MPADAPAVKRAATEGYGGEVILYDRERDDREAIGRRIARRARPDPDSALRSPRRHRRPGHGGRRAARRSRPARCPARPLRRRRAAVGQRHRRARARARHCRVIGVEPAAGDDATRSFRTQAAADRRQPADGGRRRPHAVARNAHLPARPRVRPRHDDRRRSRRCCRRCSSCGSG